MSRIEIPANDTHGRMVVGWDRPLQTFYAQAFDRLNEGDPCDCPVCGESSVVARVCGDEDSVEITCGGKCGVVVHEREYIARWLGAGERIHTVEDLAELLGYPWERALGGRVQEVLERHQESNEGNTVVVL